MLRFENLCKRYDDSYIFKGISYAASAGCFAVTDESGSGKSTLLSILAGAIAPDEGDVWIGGYSLLTAPLKAKALLSYIPEDCMPDPMMTGLDYLQRIASDRQTTVDARTIDLADRFDLTPHEEKRFEQMSFGTRKKFFLTATMIGESAVVIADEPAAGLDAPARAVLSELFKTLSQHHAVFFSSYDVSLTNACNAVPVNFGDMTSSTPRHQELDPERDK